MAKLLSALIAVALATTAVSAHHSFAAEYNANDQATLVGTITKVEWTNPHTWFYIDVKDPQGNVVNWAIEGGAPTVLYREGWKPNSLKVGDKVTVKGSHARDTTQNAGAAREIVTADGKSFIVGPAGDEPTP